MIKNFVLKTWIWITFIRNKEVLPTNSKNTNPKMEYEGFSGAFIWEDEGLWELRNHNLVNAFKYVIHHRMTLVVGSKNDVGVMRSYSFDKQIFEMAKKHFPNWIGFHESRCSYNSEIANSMMRIRKVADWRFQKLLNEE
ncbi:hypothetical protein P8625_14480 [Tenacibaculum tangerinum]|uniref:Uncharacterized protein n=1 Tax=Tenacibaculum tangerinum TaxID=3038772 RepID=A0ABY8L1C6_9FLAO|nr:hypothetical protein [Tenacibaculum tangerinum]WGH75263.1 hypothetical protein P8625_14480 [Tenacibaculum tangerinum]